ncbi:MAG: galactokinase [Lentisphaerae bacterium]|jgi:galactokinase|nr:galactokinase [Lentisphaerota bacterium]MBT4822801.1 galactokinase [Lentisphaerota bacterium]MBT5606518.1 galactokinase [Lentisphaerota bacterium]MBT7060151.1 galactokinase [Lentisphaerota bacterium]MBT7845330.1 galactokinase [Lentisphaerota bacterium]
MKEQLVSAFVERFDARPTVVTRAPGRLEILGNHTDYNEGVVLSVAVDRAAFVAAGAVPGGTCCIRDIMDGSERTFSLDSLDSPTSGDWANYVKGVVVELQKRGIEIPAFEAVFGSTVPMSAGMSSSAALEISVAYALGELAGADLPWQEWAKVGQGAENNYVGAKTGLLDQFSSIKGKAGQLVFSDFRTLEVENVPIPEGTALVVANSMVKHTLTNEYNDRRESCEDAVASLKPRMPDITALRDVSRADLERHREALDPVSYQRALHVVGENERVMAGISALEDNKLAAFGDLMFDSQNSSTQHFENSCDELDTLVAIGKTLPGAIGARLSGGGFGGITVHLVEADKAEPYSEALADVYSKQTGLESEAMICQPADGANTLFKA